VVQITKQHPFLIRTGSVYALFFSFSKAQIIKNTVEMGLKRLISTAVEAVEINRG
jgi:hypothetical protein